MRQAWLLAAALLLAPFAAWAQADAPVRLTQHVTDQTGTLTPAQVAELEAPLVELEKRKGAQVAILLVATTGDKTIEEYSLAVAEGNKLGRAKPDDGLLLLVAKDDHRARIEVGYGLEGAVTDALASRIIREYLTPKFRENDYFGGLKDAEAALVKLVDGEQLPAPMVDEPSGGGSPDPIVAIILGLFIGIFASVTRLRPVPIRRLGAGLLAAGVGWLLLGLGATALIAAVVAFLFSGSGGGRFGSGRGGWGSFPSGGGGWSGGGGGGWSGGGGSFGGGGASGSW